VDGDGHIWVADEMTDRLQVFNREGQLLTYVGSGHGNLPGQFRALVGVAIDKKNRVFTTEQYLGRLQEFRYVTDAEAAAEKAKRDEELQKAAEQHKKAGEPAKPTDAAPQSAPSAPAPNASTAPKAPGE
jgi:sRNA-binding protein